MEEIVRWSRVLEVTQKRPFGTANEGMPTTRSLRCLAEFIQHEASHALSSPRNKRSEARYPFAALGDFGDYKDRKVLVEMTRHLITLLDRHERQ